MIITPTTDHNIIKSIITNPGLFKMVDGQNESVTRENFIVDDTFDYLVAENHSTYFGLISLKQVTATLVESHIRVIPYYFKTGLSIEIALNALKWAAENTTYLKTITYVPGNAYHMLKFLKHLQFQPCGIINDGIVWNQELVPLITFEKTLVRA